MDAHAGAGALLQCVGCKASGNYVDAVLYTQRHTHEQKQIFGNITMLYELKLHPKSQEKWMFFVEVMKQKSTHGSIIHS